MERVHLLGHFVASLDQLCEDHRIERVKTVGEEEMSESASPWTGGFPTPLCIHHHQSPATRTTSPSKPFLGGQTNADILPASAHNPPLFHFIGASVVQVMCTLPFATCICLAPIIARPSLILLWMFIA